MKATKLLLNCMSTGQVVGVGKLWREQMFVRGRAEASSRLEKVREIVCSFILLKILWDRAETLKDLQFHAGDYLLE